MYKYFIIILLACLSCTREQALISNRERLDDIRKMLEEQKQLSAVGNIDVWKIFDQQLSSNERQALEFLYAYAPLSDWPITRQNLCWLIFV